MKKLFFTLALAAFIFVQSHAQKLDEYTAKNDVHYAIGDTVRLGHGSGLNNQFVYLMMGGIGAMATAGSTPMAISSGYANTNVIIKKIRAYKMKGAEKVYFTVGAGNISNYNLAIDDAIDACEVVPCASTAEQTTGADDVVEKLTKLKALLDSGAITQEEFDKMKSDILK